MIDGYSDYEGDSWLSITEGADSFRLGYLPEVLEEDEARQTRGADRSSIGSTFRDSSAGPEEEQTAQLVDISDNESAKVLELAPVVTARTVPRRREASPSAARSVSFIPPISADTDTLPIRASTAAYPYPRVQPSASARSLSLSMAGPFPSPNRQSIVRPDAPPMYDIRSTDYFNVVPGATGSAVGRGRDARRLSTDSREGSGSRGRRSSPRPPGGVMGTTMVEEPSNFTPTEIEKPNDRRWAG